MQLSIETELSPGLSTADLFRITCKPQNEESLVDGKTIKNKPGPPFCGRIKYHYPLEHPIIYSAKSLNGMPDFVVSAEYYGWGAAAYRFIFARTKVINLLEQRGLRGLKPIRPINLVD